MTKNIRFFFAIQSARLGRELVNPVNSFIELLGSICYFFLHLISFSLIIGKFSFPDWSRGEMWIMLFTFQAFTYAAFFIYWKGLVHTVRDINRGAFDFLLTKPVSCRLITFFRSGGLHNLVCLLLGLSGVFFSAAVFGIHIRLISVLIYVLALIASLWIFHSLTVIIISLNFFFGYLPGTSSVGFQVQEIYKYPSSIFGRQNLWAWLSVIPLSLLTTIPVTSFLTKPINPLFFYVYIVMLIVSTVASMIVWHLALRNYSSSGS